MNFYRVIILLLTSACLTLSEITSATASILDSGALRVDFVEIGIDPFPQTVSFNLTAKGTVTFGCANKQGKFFKSPTEAQVLNVFTTNSIYAVSDTITAFVVSQDPTTSLSCRYPLTVEFLRGEYFTILLCSYTGCRTVEGVVSVQ